MKVLEVVSGIIENDRGEVLLAQRPPGKHLSGSWEFPGGKIEKNETSIAALHRELKEELDLLVEVQENLGQFPFEYEWGRINLHVFIVKAGNSPTPTADVQVFKWVKANQIDADILVAADREPLFQYLAARSRP